MTTRRGHTRSDRVSGGRLRILWLAGSEPLLVLGTAHARMIGITDLAAATPATMRASLLRSRSAAGGHGGSRGLGLGLARLLLISRRSMTTGSENGVHGVGELGDVRVALRSSDIRCSGLGLKLEAVNGA